MSKYYCSYNLESVHSVLLKTEILPRLEENYFHHQFFVLLPDKVGVLRLKNQLLKDFSAISSGFLMTLKEFKEEFYSNIRWDSEYHSGTDKNRFKDGILMNKTARALLIKKTLEEVLKEESPNYFKSILNYRGFRRDLSNVISDIKLEMFSGKGNQYGFDIKDVANYFNLAIKDSPGMANKMDSLMVILEKYERIRLESNLLDHSDLDCHINTYFANADHCDSFLAQTKKIYLFGFHRLDQLDLSLLKILSDKGIEIIISFYNDPQRPELFFEGERIKKKLDSLKFQNMSQTINPGLSSKSLILNILSKELFNDSFSLESELPYDTSSIKIIKGETRRDEVIQVAKRIKDLLTKYPRLSLDEIAVVIRNPNIYRQDISTVFNQFKIPFYESSDEQLIHEKLVHCILLIIELKIKNYPSDLVMELIKNNYFYLRNLESDTGEKNTRAIVQTIDKYYQRIKFAQKDILQYLKSVESLSEEVNHDVKNAILYIEKLKTVINGFPSIHENVLVYDLVTLLKNIIIDNFSILYNVYLNKELSIVKHDSLVLRKVLDLLDEYIYFKGYLSDEKTNLLDFYKGLKDIFYDSTFHSTKEWSGRVHCLQVEEVISLPYQYVFVVGLLEDEFPKKQNLNSIIKDSEKEILNYKKSIFLTSDKSSLREEFYFYSAISAAQKEVYLSYPLVSEGGRETLSSFFIDELSLMISKDVNDLVVDRNRDEFYSTGELLEHYGKSFTVNSQERSEELFSLILNSHIDPNLVKYLNAKISAEINRYSLEFSEFEGRILDCESGNSDVVIEQLKASFSEISPSHLEMFGGCPHRFLFYHVLGLRPVRGVEETISMAEKGNAVHYILHQLYTKRIDEPELFVPENIDWIRNETIAIAKNYFENEMTEGKRTTLFWGSSFDRLIYELVKFIRLDISNTDGFNPIALEFEFGSEKSNPDLALFSKSGEKFLSIKGVIDRIDMSDDNKMRAIDYKSGAAMTKNVLTESILCGMRFQPVLYSLKAEEVFDASVESWNYYYVLASNEKSLNKRDLLLREKRAEAENHNWIDITKYYILSYLDKIHGGEFPASPKECFDYCEFKHVCRVDLYLAKKKEENQPFWLSLKGLIEKYNL